VNVTPIIAFVLACGQDPPLAIEAVGVDGAVEVHTSEPVSRIDIIDGAGHPVATRRLDPPLDRVSMPATWQPGAQWTARATIDDRSAAAPVQLPDVVLPVEVEVQAPLGQDGQRVEDGAVVSFPLQQGGTASVGLVIRTRSGGAGLSLDAELGEEQLHRDRLVPGESAMLTAEISGPAAGSVDVGGIRIRVQIEPQLYAPGAPGAPDLQIVGGHFPCFPDGSPDALRPADRVELPSTTWTSILRAAGLGTRGRDEWAPWSWQSVAVHNPGDLAANAVIRVTVLGPDGLPAAPFRPRLRESNDGTGQVSVLLRVPPGQTATAVLPLFADATLLGTASGSWTRRVEATLLGAPTAAARADFALHTRSGRSWVSAAFSVLLVTAAAGIVVLGRSLRGWLGGRTSDLVTISLFGTLDFVLRTTAGLLASAFAAVLGPFAILVTGLLDDVLHISLLATLLTLLPRPGTASLAVILGWLLRGLVSGGFAPQDLIFLGSKVFLLEASLYLSGLTRRPEWRDGTGTARWLRLSLGLAPAHALTTGLALVGHMVFFRLFLADWYIAMVMLLPGFIYVLIAAGFATRLSDSLRRVEP
jgi:hypothetical protein